MPKVVAIIQARMSSRRLPGKSLMPIVGKPMLQRVVERVRQTQGLDQVTVGTSIDKSDDAIEALCWRIGVRCFRGSQEDVLERYYQCACKERADVIMRVTGDCPVWSPEVGGEVLAMFLERGWDYCSNVRPVSFPDGLDTEVLSFDTLWRCWDVATLRSEREHPTSFVWNRARQFRIGNLSYDDDLSHYRLCVDEQRDLDLVRAIYAELGEDPKWLDVVELLESRPDLVVLNSGIRRNEGMERSLREDANV